MIMLRIAGTVLVLLIAATTSAMAAVPIVAVGALAGLWAKGFLG